MAKSPKKIRTPRETTALTLGFLALLLAVLTIMALLFLVPIAAIVLGCCTVLCGFISLMVDKAGTLPAVVGIGAGFLSVLSAIITMKML